MTSIKAGRDLYLKTHPNAQADAQEKVQEARTKIITEKPGTVAAGAALYRQKQNAPKSNWEQFE